MAKVLLVLGNGFDLACGLESSFKNYLKSEYYRAFRDCVSSVNKFITNTLASSSVIPPQNTDTLSTLFRKLTFWDLYFAIPMVENFSDIKLWYDFEKKLRGFLTSIHTRGESEYLEIDTTSWSVAEQRVKREKEATYYLALRLYLDFVTNSTGQKDLNRRKVYEVLFDDLKKYEGNFGKYISSQQTIHLDYIVNAQSLIEKLLSDRDDELAYINTFNYSDLSKASSGTAVWHINGDAECPIFGVDYKEIGIEDSRYKYTKTFRRLELNGKSHTLCNPDDKDYSKVIVFGHSLNEQDYNYFFALFNRLNLSNERGRRKGYTIEFAYSPHDGQTSEEARVKIMTKALGVLQSYNEEILHEKGFRLMDILYFSGAIKFREV